MLALRKPSQFRFLQHTANKLSSCQSTLTGLRQAQLQSTMQTIPGSRTETNYSNLATTNSCSSSIQRLHPEMPGKNINFQSHSILNTRPFVFALPGMPPLSKDHASQRGTSQQNSIANSILSYMRNGDLVPDSLVQSALQARLSQKDCIERGWVLDGYPRTAEQARILLSSDVNSRPEIIIELHTDSATAMHRLESRSRGASPSNISALSCHTSNNYKASVIRPDDGNSVVARRRLADYESLRPSILSVLHDHGVPVLTIDAGGNQSVEQIANAVSSAVGAARRIVLIGRAGCGKSVQGRLLQSRDNERGPVHVSTGDLLRQWAHDIESRPHVYMHAKVSTTAEALV